MKTSEKRSFYDLAEQLLNAVYICRTVLMAIDFLSQTCSRESIEAIQCTLRMQKSILDELFQKLDNEKLLESIQLNWTVAMALDFLDQCCSSESVEAIQCTLRMQEDVLNKLYPELEYLGTNFLYPVGSVFENENT